MSTRSTSAPRPQPSVAVTPGAMVIVGQLRAFDRFAVGEDHRHRHGRKITRPAGDLVLVDDLLVATRPRRACHPRSRRRRGAAAGAGRNDRGRDGQGSCGAILTATRVVQPQNLHTPLRNAQQQRA